MLYLTGIASAFSTLLLWEPTIQPPSEVDDLIVEVAAGERERIDTIVSFVMPMTWITARTGDPSDTGQMTRKAWELVDVETGARVPVQIDYGALSEAPSDALLFDPASTRSSAHGVFLLDRPLKPGQTRRYALHVVDSRADRPSTHPRSLTHPRAKVKPERSSRIRTFLVDNKPVATYLEAIQDPPAEIDPVFRRGGFLHPVRTPDGHVLTDDFPPDHAHQHGVFFAWVNTKYRGESVDFWNQAKQLGDVEPVDVLSTADGPVFGEIRAEHRHIAIRDGDRIPVLQEFWNVRVYALGDPHVIDLTSQIRLARDQDPNASLMPSLPTLEVMENRYGGFAVRGRRGWIVESNSDFLTEGGKSRLDGNHTRPRWASLYGKIVAEDDSESGPSERFGSLSVIDMPTNPRYPQPVRLAPNRPYFCKAPMVLGPFTIDSETRYQVTYRLVADDGKPDAERLTRMADDLEDPPTIHVLMGGRAIGSPGKQD